MMRTRAAPLALTNLVILATPIRKPATPVFRLPSGLRTMFLPSPWRSRRPIRPSPNKPYYLCAGIGFYPLHEARKRTDLIEVVAHQDDWQVPLWLVTHVDMHRTAKVQGFLNVLKEQRENQ